MRLRDLGDYLALRRHLAQPWEFIRLRKTAGLPEVVAVRFRNGREVWIRRDSMDRHILNHIFARDEYRLSSARGPLGTVIDVGAHIGLFAIRVSSIAEKVLSFEPEPSNFDLLTRNVRGLTRVFPEKRAVGGRAGPASLFLCPTGAGHSLHGGSPSRPSHQVERVTLEEIFARHALERCDLLKLDCEVAEYEILGGLPPSLW